MGTDDKAPAPETPKKAPTFYLDECPEVEAVLGQKLVRVGLLPSHKSLIMQFGRKLFFVKPEPSHSCIAVVLNIEVGELKDDVPDGSEGFEADFKAATKSIPHLEALVGKTLTGFEGGSFIFDNDYHIRVDMETIQVARRLSKTEEEGKPGCPEC